MSWSGELAQVSRSGEGNAAVVLIFSVECVDCVFPLTPPHPPAGAVCLAWRRSGVRTACGIRMYLLPPIIQKHYFHCVNEGYSFTCMWTQLLYVYCSRLFYEPPSGQATCVEERGINLINMVYKRLHSFISCQSLCVKVGERLRVQQSIPHQRERQKD